jgi:hypothetical protein
MDPNQPYGINWQAVYNPVYTPPYMLNPYTEEAKRLWRMQQASKRNTFSKKYPAKAAAQRAAWARTAKKARKPRGGVKKNQKRKYQKRK